MQKHIFASISLTVRDPRNFLPIGYLSNLLLAIFKKNFLSPKMAAILEMEKHKFASISLTVRDPRNFLPIGYLSKLLFKRPVRDTYLFLRKFD